MRLPSSCITSATRYRAQPSCTRRTPPIRGAIPFPPPPLRREQTDRSGMRRLHGGRDAEAQAVARRSVDSRRAPSSRTRFGMSISARGSVQVTWSVRPAGDSAGPCASAAPGSGHFRPLRSRSIGIVPQTKGSRDRRGAGSGSVIGSAGSGCQQRALTTRRSRRPARNTNPVMTTRNAGRYSRSRIPRLRTGA